MKSFLTRAFALTFTADIYKRLGDPKVIGFGTPRLSPREVLRSPMFYRAEGLLSLRTHGESGETIVPVCILVHSNWMSTPPIAYCAAEFIRREPDWHVQPDGSLCHVLPDQWAWKISQWWELEMDVSKIAEDAASWCCQNIDSLITRHLHGHQVGIKKWPRLWDQWGHGTKGVAEFQRALTSQP